MKKLLLITLAIFTISCSDRKKELESERDKNLKLRMHYQEMISEKQKRPHNGNDYISKEIRADIEKIEAVILKLELRYKTINDSIEILK
ncbi:hypothetical protein [Flavobacterium psychrophilum]|uniref:hypothetical protein n=1 Tax=Flavobacterium psychrophilum TaxID=96345 RepID=UPI000B7C26CD|nr:hypothetical protein [Flavobacterium psychrophilum]SNB03294.1 hypothetical protein FPC831_2200001 [Flavobacterium psychrophilum]